MYKYLIYCSVSAVIIIAAKYVYQNWIKQNHTIATIKQEIQLLQTKVKTVEEHIEKNKGSMSGGVKIPITFKKIENAPKVQEQPVQKQSPSKPTQVKQNVEKTIQLGDDLSSASSSGSSRTTSSSRTSSSSESSRSSGTSSKSKSSGCSISNLLISLLYITIVFNNSLYNVLVYWILSSGS